MSDPFSLEKLLDTLNARYPILGNKAGQAEEIIWWTDEGKALTVWHVINSKNHGGGSKDWDGNYSCQDCGMVITKEEIDAAGKALFNKGRECHWPLPMYLAMEVKGMPFYCMERVPQFAPKGYEPGPREGDEEWVDEPSGITIVGRLNDDTWKRDDASALSRDEVRLDLSDTEFKQWWYSINSESAWSKKAFFILSWVRKELRVEGPPRFIEAVLGDGRRIKVPNPKWKPPDVEVDPEGPVHEGDDEDDGSICSTCECFKPCECPPAEEDGEEDTVCETCQCFKPCECPEEEGDDICIVCECFLPCDCPDGS